MRSNRPRNVHPDGPNLSLAARVVAGLRPAIGPQARHHTVRFRPSPSQPRQAPSRNSEITASPNQHFLQPPNKVHGPKRRTPRPRIYNRIAGL